MINTNTTGRANGAEAAYLSEKQSSSFLFGGAQFLVSVVYHCFSFHPFFHSCILHCRSLVTAVLLLMSKSSERRMILLLRQTEHIRGHQ